MRLLIATPLYPPEIGGPATYSKLLKDGLSEYDISVSLVTFATVRTYPKLVRHLLYFYKVFTQTKHADVVLALDPVSTGLPACIAARLRHKPFIVKVVGDYAWEQGVQRFGITSTLDEFVTQVRVALPVKILRLVQKVVANSAIRVLVPSNYLKGIVETWGINGDKIDVIYNAIERIEGGMMATSVENTSRPRIVTAGRLVPWKNIDKIIDSFVDIQKHFPSATLVVAGDGSERSALQLRAATHLAGGYVFTGTLSSSDMHTLLASADIFVLNSTYEGLSHILIEALVAGIPVVATDAGGNRELVEDGKNGLLVKVGDTEALTQAFMRILGDPAYAKSMARSAEQTGERFSKDRMLKATAAFLRTI